MARKKLLTEGEIRQFMKLANLRPIGQDRLSEYGGMPPGDREEMDDVEAVDADLDADLDAEVEVDDMAAADTGAEVVLDDADAAAIAAAAPAMQKVADAVDPEPPMDDMEPADDVDPMAAMAGDMEEDPPAPMMEADEIVNQVVKRVRTRMMAEQKAARRKSQRNEVLADQLAERIMKRLTK